MSQGARSGAGPNLGVRKRPCPCVNCELYCLKGNLNRRCKLSDTVPVANLCSGTLVKFPVSGGGGNSDAAGGASVSCCQYQCRCRCC